MVSQFLQGSIPVFLSKSATAAYIMFACCDKATHYCSLLQQDNAKGPARKWRSAATSLSNYFRHCSH